MKQNPFIYGRSLEPQEIVNREQALRFVFSRLGLQQSVAIIGQSHMGKTSLLKVIKKEREKLAQEGHMPQCVISSIDVPSILDIKNLKQFWHRVLMPLEERIKQNKISKIVVQSYVTAYRNHFNELQLERLFESMRQAGMQFLLILDEFETFLHHPYLNTAEFYAVLRSTVSRFVALTTIIASRQDLEELHNATKHLTVGSPFVNFFNVLHLETFSEREAVTLLEKGKTHFSPEHYKLIMESSGRNPYLMQAIANRLWDAIDTQKSETRQEMIIGELSDDIRNYFMIIWDTWPLGIRQVATIRAILQAPDLFGNQYNESKLVEYLHGSKKEIKYLQRSGILGSQTNETPLMQELFLVWLEDQILKQIRNETDFSAWLDSLSLSKIIVKDDQKLILKQIMSVQKHVSLAFLNALVQKLVMGDASI